MKDILEFIITSIVDNDKEVEILEEEQDGIVNLTINATDLLVCNIRMSNGSILIINQTGLSINGENYSLDYTVKNTDSIVNHANFGYLPWILKNCTITNSSSSVGVPRSWIS